MFRESSLSKRKKKYHQYIDIGVKSGWVERHSRPNLYFRVILAGNTNDPNLISNPTQLNP